MFNYNYSRSCRMGRGALNVGLISSVLLISDLTSEGQVLYRETFGRDPANGTGNIGMQNFDWGRWNTAGTVSSTTSGVNGTDSGRPIDLENVNAGSYYLGATPGPYDRGWAFLDGTARLTMTTEYSFDPSSYASGSLEFSWYQGNNTSIPTNDFRLALRIGTTWYVSAQSFANVASVTGGANFGTLGEGAGGAELMSLIYDPAAANWLTLTFDGDFDINTHTATAATGALAVGGVAGADLSGTINAFGLYRDNTGQNARFDSFTITVIPEPATCTLVGLGVLGVVLRRKYARG